MKDITSYLRSVIRHEKKGSINYTIADTLLAYEGDYEHLTTDLLAKQCNVSKASISRFCRFVGLEDFNSLKELLKEGDYTIQVKFKYDGNTLYDYLDEVEKHIKAMKNIPLEHIDMLIDDLFKYESIYLLGISHSIEPAQRLQYDLAFIDKKVEVVDSLYEQRQILSSQDESKLVIIFSNTNTLIQKVLPNTRILEKNKHPVIYTIGCSYLDVNYIKKQILLADKKDYSTEILCSLFVNMILVRMKERGIF